MDSKGPENAQIVSLSEEDRAAISSVLQRNISEAIAEDATAAPPSEGVIGVYVDPPGVCIAVPI